MENTYEQTKLFCGFAKIYALTNVAGDVFYVGCTTRDLETRVEGHLYEAKYNDTRTAKRRRINELGGRILAKELDRIWVTGRNVREAHLKARDLESQWIQKFLLDGIELTNVSQREHSEITPMFEQQHHKWSLAEQIKRLINQ